MKGWAGWVSQAEDKNEHHRIQKETELAGWQQVALHSKFKMYVRDWLTDTESAPHETPKEIHINTQINTYITGTNSQDVFCTQRKKSL